MSSYGQLGRVGISFQNSYGTSNTTSMHWLEPISESVALQKPPLISEALRGVFDDGEHYEGANLIGGDLAIEVAAIPLGVLLKGAVGAPTSVQSAGIYTHTFLPPQSDAQEDCANPPFTMHKYYDVGSADVFSDLNISVLELSIANGELLQATATIVGGTEGHAAASTATYRSETHFPWQVASVSIAGAGNCDVADMTVTLDNALEAQHTLCAKKYPSRIKRTGFRTLTVGGTIKFADTNEYQAFLAQSERFLKVHFEGLTSIQSGYNEAITIEVPLLRHTEFSPQAGGPGELEVGFSSKGVYSVGSSYSCKFTVVNTIAGY